MSDGTKCGERDGFQPRELKSILIADESVEDARALANVIEALGYTVVGPATTALEAKRLAENEKPQLAMIDISFCDDALQPVAADLVNDLSIEVAVVTDRDDSTHVETCHDVGVMAYWQKPITEAHLRAALPVAWHRNEFFRHFEDSADRYKRRLDERREIEMAKWLLVKHEGLEEPEAMRVLQKSARDQRKKLIDAVRQVISAHEEPVA